MEEPEFNNGFVTALALFYAHREQFKEARKLTHDMRIYAASDHLFDLEYPENIDTEVKEKVEVFTNWVFSVRLGSLLSWEEGEKIFDACKDILKLIDERIFGLKVIINYP